jgi:TonB family protein
MGIARSFSVAYIAVPPLRKLLAFSFSVCLHGGGLILLVWADRLVPVAQLRGDRVQMLPTEIARNSKVIWYDFRASVPKINPERPFGPAKQPQGQKESSSRTLIAQSPEPSSNKQFIWQPDRPKPLTTDVPTPNLVALPPPPPKPAPRAFIPPAPSPVPQARAPVVLAEPPTSAQTTKLALPQNAIIGRLAQLNAAAVPRPAFKAPTVNGTTGSQPATKPQLLAEPPAVVSSKGSGDGLKAVIVGLNPEAGPAPPGSRPGQFSQAPVTGVPSSGTSPQPGAPTVPGLMARGSSGAPPPVPAHVAPPPPDLPKPERRLLKELTLPSMNRTMSAPLRPSSRIIPASVEARFVGRDVYTLVIPCPEFPGYTGDWILWFSERHTRDDQGSRVQAPIPIRKYSWTASTQMPADSLGNGTIQLASIIDRDGHVSGVRVLRGGATAEAFRQRALEELQTWEFQPALRNGEPVDIDVVLEIPFQFTAGQ